MQSKQIDSEAKEIGPETLETQSELFSNVSTTALTIQAPETTEVKKVSIAWLCFDR